MSENVCNNLQKCLQSTVNEIQIIYQIMMYNANVSVLHLSVCVLLRMQSMYAPVLFLLPKAGLCGGSYYRTAAVLDAFSDERLGNRRGYIRSQLLDGLHFASVTKLVGQTREEAEVGRMAPRVGTSEKVTRLRNVAKIDWNMLGEKFSKD